MGAVAVRVDRPGIKPMYVDRTYWVCSECDGKMHTGMFNYCPWCGAKFKRKEEPR